MTENVLSFQAPFAGVYDTLIVGGGINGVGIARDAAGRGLRVLLLEQSDLAAHTSSASTKLIHGGLRYLEYGEFRLVREALQERERLLRIAPHLVRPLRFVIPVGSGSRPHGLLRLGLWIYDHLGGRQTVPGSEALNLRTQPEGEGLEPGYRQGFAYWDCAVDDSRLVVLNSVDAARRGAEIRTRTQLLEARREGGQWQVLYQDRRTGQHYQARARAHVNVGGPWVGALDRTVFQRPVPTALRLLKGSHIVVPRCYAGAHAYLFQLPDRRVIFTIPYEQNWTLIGTTDCPFAGDPATAAITPEEVEYLCAGANRFLRAKLQPHDVTWAYAGVRPLLNDHRENAAAVTRDYRLELDGGPQAAVLLTVCGGKLTTYRRLAEQALERLQPVLGFTATSWTGGIPLPGGDFPSGDFQRFSRDVHRRWPHIPTSLLDRYARAYGTDMEALLGAAESVAELGEDLGGGLFPAEIDYLVDREWAQTPEDILWRRTKLGLHVPPGTADRLDTYLANRRSASPVVPVSTPSGRPRCVPA